ncbi:hypothetical protein ElyMa_003015700 [Elysia marginata]|uniref:Uncharacterized protein n=1 Tax=Elysia marginata TaxID=1093978 RepID=A0AAV4IJF5_9GAST|nr:hypothetical protein ElyMa_003015700 [Elysia marginata]
MLFRNLIPYLLKKSNRYICIELATSRRTANVQEYSECLLHDASVSILPRPITPDSVARNVDAGCVIPEIPHTLSLYLPVPGPHALSVCLSLSARPWLSPVSNFQFVMIDCSGVTSSRQNQFSSAAKLVWHSALVECNRKGKLQHSKFLRLKPSRVLSLMFTRQTQAGVNFNFKRTTGQSPQNRTCAVPYVFFLTTLLWKGPAS